MPKHYETIQCDPVKLSEQLNRITPLCSDIKVINTMLAQNQIGMPVLIATIEIEFSTEIQKNQYTGKEEKVISLNAK